MDSSDFCRTYYECRDKLPNEKMRSSFDAALIGGLSIYLPEDKARFVMGVALDAAQSFNQPRLQLVKRVDMRPRLVSANAVRGANSSFMSNPHSDEGRERNSALCMKPPIAPRQKCRFKTCSTKTVNEFCYYHAKRIVKR